ncbi:alkaline shock response membrane anchor protein AmaP [Pediococcus claussenii]|uniref:Alkaline shock response membrane anchor protein AmaP n=1 Tax=Pediococcus claussenii (strain ATCC BAA-344 / DSM 14800 / JCM 18046 / KCTC 3811 / LMG 21948 / P06) TaxID=701521 RepID=G8PAK0_PEDCP|nr:alkaline shock response membrane anchor protein AmaP [Pediococcus claussenii]AEV95789.1 hypothetical protein PECL_1571 [Pediococcus claussenii ATCC BAA-344]ANZ69290.1 hypothetical protein AYR57_02780 [Pediococcus claussenii]ANZ71110.1 hypothetical protein AYR58_02795 [Pediococcus claussenii]
MNRVTKSLIGIISIIVVLQVLWFISLLIRVPKLNEFTEQILPVGAQATSITAIVFAACTLLFAICALLLITVTRTAEKDLTVKNNQGRMTVSRKAIEKMVNQAASSNADLSNIHSSIKLHSNGKQAHVYVEAISLSDRDFQAKARELQSNVNDSLQKYLGVKSKTKVHIIPRRASSENLKVT